MIYGLRERFGGQAGLWLAGVVFATVGLVLLFVVPTSAPWGSDHGPHQLLYRILGGFFLVFGAVILAAMVWGSVLGTHDPTRREEVGWWVNFLGGAVGAAAFSVPATLALPVFLFAWSRRPNALFPPGASARGSILMASAFSAVGILGLVLTVFMVRATLRSRRHRVRREASRHPTG